MSSVERLLADGYWRDGVFTGFGELELKAIEDAFANRALAQLHKRELITDDDVASTSSAEQRRYCHKTIRASAVSSAERLGDPFHDKESEQFIAARLSLSKTATSSALPCPWKNSQYRTTS